MFASVEGLRLEGTLKNVNTSVILKHQRNILPLAFATCYVNWHTLVPSRPPPCPQLFISYLHAGLWHLTAWQGDIHCHYSMRSSKEYQVHCNDAKRKWKDSGELLFFSFFFFN